MQRTYRFSVSISSSSEQRQLVSACNVEKLTNKQTLRRRTKILPQTYKTVTVVILPAHRDRSNEILLLPSERQPFSFSNVIEIKLHPVWRLTTEHARARTNSFYIKWNRPWDRDSLFGHKTHLLWVLKPMGILMYCKTDDSNESTFVWTCLVKLQTRLIIYSSPGTRSLFPNWNNWNLSASRSIAN